MQPLDGLRYRTTPRLRSHQGVFKSGSTIPSLVYIRACPGKLKGASPVLASLWHSSRGAWKCLPFVFSCFPRTLGQCPPCRDSADAVAWQDIQLTYYWRRFAFGEGHSDETHSPLTIALSDPNGQVQTIHFPSSVDSNAKVLKTGGNRLIFSGRPAFQQKGRRIALPQHSLPRTAMNTTRYNISPEAPDELPTISVLKPLASWPGKLLPDLPRSQFCPSPSSWFCTGENCRAGPLFLLH